MQEFNESQVPDGFTIAALHPTEVRLLRLLKDLEYGRLDGELARINVQAGYPVSAEVRYCVSDSPSITATKQIRLDK